MQGTSWWPQGRGADLLLLCVWLVVSTYRRRDGEGMQVPAHPGLSCPWAQSGVSNESPKALLLLVPVVKEEKSLVLP